MILIELLTKCKFIYILCDLECLSVVFCGQYRMKENFSKNSRKTTIRIIVK